MSLINKMLQDLEARRPQAQGGGEVPLQVRAVGGGGQRRIAWWWIALACALAVALAVALTLIWLRRPGPNAMPAAAPVAGVAAQTAASVPPPPVQQAAAAPVAAAPEAPAQALALRTEAELRTPVRAPVQEPAPVAITPADAAKRPNRTGPAEPAATKRMESGQTLPVERRELRALAAQAQEELARLRAGKEVAEPAPGDRAEAEYRRSTGLIQQGRGAEAIEALQRALANNPGHAAARHTLVGLLIESKRAEEALRIAGEGLRADPDQPGMAMVAARLLLEKGQLAAAADTLRATLPYVADRADYRAFLAALLQRQDRHKEAIEQYQAALRASPHSGVWWMGLGISLQAVNRYAEAGEAYRRAMASNALAPELRAFVEQKLKQVQR